MWDPESQTYAGGTVPSHHSSMGIDDLLASNSDGRLKIFGYGSLCWHPGSDGVLSLANIEEDERDHDAAYDTTSDDGGSGGRPRRKVTTAPGRAIGYRRCWSQRSADHRGTTEFNGIVCTLLSDDEVRGLMHMHHDGHSSGPSLTEGLIYTVDEDLVDDCLAELDFREKGGYARDVIDVVEDDTGATVKALLYRGTPDNPAFWKRALLDPPYAAAVISAAVGPSGPNDVYLLHLHSFLDHAARHSPAAALALTGEHSGDDVTGELAGMVRALQSDFRPYFLFGAGSNERDQLLLSGSAGGIKGGTDVDEVHELMEMLLVVPRRPDDSGNRDNAGNDVGEAHRPKSLHAGGGHSAMLTHGGDLYLWGWNDAGQLGRASSALESSVRGDEERHSPSFNVVKPLSDVEVASADLGHTHTLIIENGTGRLFGFGENGRGQVTGVATTSNSEDGDLRHVPRTPVGLSGEGFVDAAAGLFHSAAVTKGGELVTWGCGRFGQCLPPAEVESRRHRPNGDDSTSACTNTIGRWRSLDGSKLVQVACGRRHTVVLDELGRVWTMGDNKYGQLGRSLAGSDGLSKDAGPQLVEGPLGRAGSGCFAICSGWSHSLALTRDADSGEVTLYGWGRNDKGQLGTILSPGDGSKPTILKPLLDRSKKNLASNASSDVGPAISIQSACCGAESSHILGDDANIYSTGWNEHGNLAIGHVEDDRSKKECCLTWAATSGARVAAPPLSGSKNDRKLFAAGGAHIVTMSV